MDFWRIFENFGFAVLVLNLPTLDCFLTFLISTHQIHLARVPLFVEGDKCNAYEGAEGSMGFQKSACLVHINICIHVLGGLPKTCDFYFGTEEVLFFVVF